MNDTFDVVIVGGGAAGIGAARRLAAANYSTLLLEANPRLGGRAWTQKLAGHDVDLGCGWFHSAERNAWVAIAEAAGFPIDRSTAKWGSQYRDLGFSKESRAAAWEAFGEWTQNMENPPPGDCAADVLPVGEWTNYIRAIAGFISGASLESLSIADYRAYDDASSDNNWRSPAGLGTVIAGSLPATTSLRLATPVEVLSLNANGVTLTTNAGAVHARAVILTVSTCVLAGDRVKFPAELEPWREAAARLPLGRNEKLFFEITGDSPFEPESQVLGNPHDARTGSYYIRPLGSRVIECFYGGEGARVIEEGGPESGFDFALEQLTALFGSSIRPVLRPLAASNWSRMDYIGGAYSYALPGFAAARKALAQPCDNRVFFAGEATSSRDFSTAHGAHDSGVRAAQEFIATRKT